MEKQNIRLLTLCLITQNQHILLGLKKRGFGANFWNGFGGKVHADESILNACHRELKEEAGIEAGDLQHRGVLDFWFDDIAEILQVHVFCTTSFYGIPSESEEMKPQWFSIENIPYHQMWPDDQYWIPLVLQGKIIHGKFYFHGTTLLRHIITIQEDAGSPA